VQGTDVAAAVSSVFLRTIFCVFNSVPHIPQHFYTFYSLSCRWLQVTNCCHVSDTAILYYIHSVFVQ
jgi:hypothetical protein